MSRVTPSPRHIDQWGRPPYVSVTVSYRREDGNVVTAKVGCGETFTDAINACDAQLRPGKWLRVCVSSPSPIYQDLQHRPLRTLKAGQARRRENVWVEVLAPREVVA